MCEWLGMGISLTDILSGHQSWSGHKGDEIRTEGECRKSPGVPQSVSLMAEINPKSEASSMDGSPLSQSITFSTRFIIPRFINLFEFLSIFKAASTKYAKVIVYSQYALNINLPTSKWLIGKRISIVYWRNICCKVKTFAHPTHLLLYKENMMHMLPALLWHFSTVSPSGLICTHSRQSTLLGS